MNADETVRWAKVYIDAHKNPFKKLEVPGNKFLIPSGSQAEAMVVQDSLTMLEEVISQPLVERRCSRTIANWLPEQNLAKVTKIHGNISNFGFANKSGKFLHPEETLFLLETNRLELLWENVPVSIQQAYEILLKNCNLPKYMAYKKLALQGFRLLTTDLEGNRTQTDGEPASKRCRYSHENVPMDCQESKSTEMIPNLIKADYKVFSPESTSRIVPDFNLNICPSKYIDSNASCTGDSDIPTVVNYADTEFSGFYCLDNVNLPTL